MSFKQSNYGFAEGFLGMPAEKKGAQKYFDFSKAHEIITKVYTEHPDLTAEAGLQGDWNYTGGIIFEDGKFTNDHYTFLNSNWATPTLILSWGGEEQEELSLFTYEANDGKWSNDIVPVD